jgi:hypothetical protein
VKRDRALPRYFAKVQTQKNFGIIADHFQASEGLIFDGWGFAAGVGADGASPSSWF